VAGIRRETPSTQGRERLQMTAPQVTFDDSALIKLALTDQPEYVAVLINRHLAAVRSRIGAIVPNKTDLDDLLQEVLFVEKTRQRANRSISPEQILIPLTRNHQAFYLQETGILPAQRIIQPANKGTAPPILYSLLSIEQKDREAIVAILPSDHHYSDEPLFTVAFGIRI
jgi:hypothetical protein